MRVAERTQVAHVPPSGQDGRDSDSRRAIAQEEPSSQDAAPATALSAEMVARLQGLIDAVAEELTRGQPELNRQVTRSDAIALLIATSQQIDSQAQQGQSPLMYLLMEEQQKMAALLGTADLHTQGPAFVKV